MSRHVVVALYCVRVVWLTLTHQPIEDALHVDPHVGVGVLVDCQSRGCVLDEKVQQPDSRQARQMAHNLIRH